MRVSRTLAAANVALCVVCACVALSQVVSVARIVTREGDHSCALVVGSRAATALVLVARKQRLRTRNLLRDDELKKKRRR
mmetsp:Transcript_33202/g.106002  ORF Transcript_33202/g.106002 Transcript_33202/m.106002 type:complete len:80 (-) Transcript_33202:162-401(-)